MRLKSSLAAGLCLVAALSASSQALAFGFARVFVRQEITDYAAWRQACDDFESKRHEMGGTLFAVFRSADDPNDVTTLNDFLTLEQAQAFASSADLKAILAKGGVKGTPQIWIAGKVVK